METEIITEGDCVIVAVTELITVSAGGGAWVVCTDDVKIARCEEGEDERYNYEQHSVRH